MQVAETHRQGAGATPILVIAVLFAGLHCIRRIDAEEA